MVNYSQRLKALRLPTDVYQAIGDDIVMSNDPVQSSITWQTDLLLRKVFAQSALAWRQLIVNVLTLGDIDIPIDLAATTPVNLPDFQGGSWATEWAYMRSPEQTRKFRFWRRPDPNPLPHNHPWRNPQTGVSFVSQIISGGYTEDVYYRDGGTIRRETTEYKAGDVNVCFYDGFHVVRDIENGTFTHFVTEPTIEGNVWHYFDPATSGLIEPTPIADFLEQRDRVNPR